ncbi:MULTISPECIES: preprotein translocase subunit SecE [Caulobacter]|jgi:preprotein translocase subunit SecE|uniref:Protein translocase subunit SecE n=1 Tax=Caulobacter rhizosphaerae TaxID=2010972 RepID=A0ABU1N071_9CAUL|nr:MULTISPECIES: preprotein translocase subunit SecE [Caulobacter]KQZ17827.1 preprotein translocase subunit SecE [Caulobacter sp. Root1472]MDR6531834.1 preprotein translocase subunit SecE [Caulobacter rhizosphaerae]GGL43360.1 protein translocase subunit SecE [Caulobacter rhizosphaerae]
MARKPGSSPSAIKNRAAKTAAALSPSAQGGAATAAAKAPAAPKKPINPVRFAQEVRAEARKITWTTRKETWITSVMVFIMVVLASLFFTFADWILGWGANLLLKIAAG